MPTARDLHNSFDRIAMEAEFDVPHRLRQTLRIGRRRRLVRRTIGVVAVAAVVALAAVLAGGRFIRSSPTPADRTPSPVTPLPIAPLMHNGPLTYATDAGIFEGSPQNHPAKPIVRASVTSFDWSPDGSVLAYTEARGGGCEIWVRDMGSGRLQKLAGCGGSQLGGQQLDWSPDGSRIAFVGSDGNIHAIGADGSDERSITAPPLRPASVSWSPDGTRIVFEMGGIWVMSSDGSSPRRIADGSWPTWSPDGRTIAFLLDRTRGPQGPGYHYPFVLQIWTVRPDGSRPKKVGQSPDCCVGASPTLGWSPDGSLLALTGASFRIVQADGSGSKILPPVPTIFPVRPSWRPVP